MCLCVATAVQVQLTASLWWLVLLIVVSRVCVSSSVCTPCVRVLGTDALPCPFTAAPAPSASASGPAPYGVGLLSCVLAWLSSLAGEEGEGGALDMRLFCAALEAGGQAVANSPLLLAPCKVALSLSS